MSLRHALIGLLAEQPASGWDLSRRFQDILGSVWPAGHPQIYGELRRLDEDGLIEVVAEGPRGRKEYRATDRPGGGPALAGRHRAGSHHPAGIRPAGRVLLADDPGRTG